MTIITNNYEKVLTEMIITKFSDNLRKVSTNINYLNNSYKFINIVSNMNKTILDIVKNSLVAIFNAIDKSYCNSIERKRKYHVKVHLPRTILTIFGEITFTRTFYTNKNNKGSYCYLDRFLSIKKQDYFDSYIKSKLGFDIVAVSQSIIK